MTIIEPGLRELVEQASDDRAEPETLSELHATGDYAIQRLIASNPATPIHVLLSLAQSGQERELRVLAVSHFAFPFHELIALMDDPDERVRVAVASNVKMTRHLLSALSGDPSPLVRAAVASNPHVHTNTANILSSDSDERVRMAVARSMKTSPEVLAILSTDESALVSVEAASNPRLSRRR